MNVLSAYFQCSQEAIAYINYTSEFVPNVKVLRSLWRWAIAPIGH